MTSNRSTDGDDADDLPIRRYGKGELVPLRRRMVAMMVRDELTSFSKCNGAQLQNRSLRRNGGPQ
jgi:hypothetical protein